MEYLLADRSFVLWLRDECSVEEQKQWDRWLRESPEHQMFVREAKEIVMAVDDEYDIPDPRKELERMDRVIDEHESRQQWEKVIFTFGRDNQPYRVISRWSAAAAIMIAVILGGLIGYYTNKTDGLTEPEIVEIPKIEEYHTDYGEKLTFKLSDGSRITLNGNSSLTFSSTVEKGLNTEVRLEGEAYFNIAHLEDEDQRTFTVQTGDGSIQVLGTRFVVNTFRDETKAVLEEGKIAINTGSTTDYELTPGQLARFKSHDNKITVKEVDTQLYTSWTENKLIFEHAPMTAVSERIEDIFGVEVVLGKYLKHETLSGSIKSTSLQVLKEALEEVLKTDISQHENQLLIGMK
ncbi:FecR family protein [Fodinibius sediminis]|uniref:FecR family protein n=1 Tax=Fodinibius sediminis TaxID=1214077 RepID=UPI00163DB715|nr:FecR family protein [Fodinibius sediminis]